MKSPAKAPAPPRKAVEVCKPIGLSPRGQALLDADVEVETFLTRLVRAGLYADGIRLLSGFLSRRRLVWWGCLCVRLTGGRPLPPPQEEALRAAVRWVLEPTEEHRQAAQAPAEAAALDTPAGCVAHGVVWTGGSMAPPEFPPFPPKPELTARAVGGGILLASAAAPPDRFVATQARLLALGMDVMAGRDLG